MKLINVRKINSNILFDIRYATTNNFTSKILYRDDSCYLLEEVAYAINNVQNELNKLGLRLVIWDAYRPLEVQEELKKYCSNTNFVSEISNHSRGISVDVSLCNLNGELLLMPTDFDDFSKKANSNYNNLDEEILKNRELLSSIMKKFNFNQNEFEWWHFDYEPLLNSPVIVDNKNII
ncbi:MAG: M15 family metallopeptidase [Nanoarchaeota archaeon]|nr:M15 family metallopeptidase [Nanoarchaeota archaeon]